MKRILIPLMGDYVAPRFDLAAEVLIVTMGDDGRILEERTLVMPRPSPEALCQLITTERISTLVCCGIEDEFYQYLVWKKVKIHDSTIGSYIEVVRRLREGTLKENDVLLERLKPKNNASPAN
jgi:predicted Fe-Mo cluster-binding NifX family protein